MAELNVQIMFLQLSVEADIDVEKTAANDTGKSQTSAGICESLHRQCPDHFPANENGDRIASAAVSSSALRHMAVPVAFGEWQDARVAAY